MCIRDSYISIEIVINNGVSRIIRRLKMEQGFGGYHPAVNFIFFAGAVLFGMFFVHPAFLLLSVGLSCTSYFLFRGRRGVRLLLGMLVLVATVSLLNPLFNPYGETVLFLSLIHISEPTRQAEISYAVFCLKKKKK